MKPINCLASEEAKKRLKEFGPNEIQQKRNLNWLKIVFDQFTSPLIYILFFAGLVTLFLKQWSDAIVIFLAVGVNTILGFFQEFKAEKSLLALQKMVVPHALVIRDDREQTIEAKDLVPGDLVILKTGDKVAADGVIVEEMNLSVNEAMLTGESAAIEKKAASGNSLKITRENRFAREQNLTRFSNRRANKLDQSISSSAPANVRKHSQICSLARDYPSYYKNYSFPHAQEQSSQVFMGTVVVGGRGKMLVTQTGMKTRMGSIAGSLKETREEETPLKNQIASLSKILALIFSIICLVIFFEGVLSQKPWLEMFTLSVAVAAAAIPESLTISLTVVLTLGMQRILKQKGLVRKLLAAETLGSVDVICADKTGTLTEGKMKVAGSDFVDSQEGLKSVILCNNMTNPLEKSMMEWALRLAPLAQGETLQNRHPRIDEIPFSSVRKYIATLHKSKKAGEAVIYLSGAPEVIMAVSQFATREKLIWQKKLDDYTKKGLRVVAFAYESGPLEKIKSQLSSLKNNLVKFDGQLNGNITHLRLSWLGLVLFEDPARLAVKPALASCRKAGIKVKVITGDYKNTALNILKKLDLEDGGLTKDSVLEGWQLEKLSDEELSQKIDRVILFARTTPEQKIRIVSALQAKGHTVAMMGDGVNDALALKKADIGVVVGSASEVAKETADMVLLDSNFGTIVKSVREGRGIFENIRKIVAYLLSHSFTEIILIGGSLLLGLPTPILAAQILWVNLVEDGLPGLALAFEPKDEGLMTEPPRKRGAPIINKQLKILVFVIGLVTDLLLFGLFLLLLKYGFPLTEIRTIVFGALVIDSLLYVFSCKSLRHNLWRINIFSNKVLTISVVVGLLMLFGGIYLPFLNLMLKTVKIPLIFWLLIGVKGLVGLMGIEGVKWLFLRNNNSALHQVPDKFE